MWCWLFFEQIPLFVDIVYWYWCWSLFDTNPWETASWGYQFCHAWVDGMSRKCILPNMSRRVPIMTWWSLIVISRLAEVSMAYSIAATTFCFGKHRYRPKAKRRRRLAQEQTKCWSVSRQCGWHCTFIKPTTWTDL